MGGGGREKGRKMTQMGRVRSGSDGGGGGGVGSEREPGYLLHFTSTLT